MFSTGVLNPKNLTGVTHQMATAFHRLQYVCGLLKLMDEGNGQVPVEYTMPEDPIPSPRCFQLIKKYMKAPEDKPTSLRDMWGFVNILYTTFSQLHDSASPLNAAMAPDPFVLSKIDNALKQSIKCELCTFLTRTARDFASNTESDDPSQRAGSGLTATGFSQSEFNDVLWRPVAFSVGGREVYKFKTFFLYFRAGSERWVIDDEIIPSGAGYSASATAQMNGVWYTSPGWVSKPTIRVTPNSQGNYVVSGCVGEPNLNGASSSYLDNGMYVKQPTTENINNRPQFVLKTAQLSARNEQRHLIYSSNTKSWKITPTCGEEEGANLIQENHKFMPEDGTWQVLPGDVTDHVRFINNNKPPPHVKPNLAQECDNDDAEEEEVSNQLAHLVPWGNSNHETMLFSNTTSTLAFFSRFPARMRERMNPILTKFLKLNKIAVGEDLNVASTKKYHKLLCALTNVARAEEEADALLNGGKFAITGDALLKFLAICMRIRCGIPVVLLGECGCGKTYSIKFIAAWLGIHLFTLDVHGGTQESDVLGVIQRAEEHAKQTNKKTMVFLDEINACVHLGLIEEVLVQRRAFGSRIDDRLILVAALNPYRMLPEVKQVDEAGLKFNSNVTSATTNKNLVYLVHPVPMSLAYLAFDYGALRPTEEDMYITSMAQNVLSGAKPSTKLTELVQTPKFIAVIVSWVSAAQQFIRTKEGDNSAASLRDAQRMLQLTVWFLGLAGSRPDPLRPNIAVTDCIVLGLAFAYMFRLSSRRLREAFWDEVRLHSTNLLGLFPGAEAYRKAGKFEQVLAATQQSFTKRFQLERGIAMNEALSENLFLCVVCILNRIPLFLVGKPGTSKTLALQIAASNLLGRSSPMPFWRKFPGLAMFTYQCSPLSTAVEIQRQFDVACRYQSHASEQVSVFVLDEVGLAEFSPSMPLKVLHSILVDPPCAVIGVSNWTLDRAKMNRAILLTRPEPSILDLHYTGKRISQSFNNNDATTEDGTDWWLREVATTFYELYSQEQQSGREFWGMRDFYVLVRQLKAAPEVNMEVLTVALCRNLGGKPEQLEKIVNRFKQVVFNM